MEIEAILKPCPFCGAKVRLNKTQAPVPWTDESQTLFQIRCFNRDCGGSPQISVWGEKSYGSDGSAEYLNNATAEKQVIERWNQRAE